MIRRMFRCGPMGGALGAWLLAAAPAGLAAQQFNVAALAGAMQYDAGADDGYFTFGLQARYFISPTFRVGLLGSTTHIDNPYRIWTAPGTDQQFWRVGALAEVATKPFHKAAVSLRGLLGINHSSGVIYQGPDGYDPFWGITDSPTGVSYGGGVGLEVGPFSRLRFLAQGNIWMDNAYGSAGFDPDLLFGIGVDL